MKALKLIAAAAAFFILGACNNTNKEPDEDTTIIKEETRVEEQAPAPVAGAMADITFNDRFGIQIGLAYNARGSKTTSRETLGFNSTTVDGEVERNFKLNYIVLPVEIRIGGDAGSMKIYGTAGLYAGYLVSGKYDIISTSGGSTIQEDSEDLDIGIHDFEYKSLDYGLQIGAGTELENGLFFKAWYFYGLATSDYWKTDFHDMKNTGVEAGMGYYIFGK